MGGLLVATILTLILLPALYVAVNRISANTTPPDTVAAEAVPVAA